MDQKTDVRIKPTTILNPNLQQPRAKDLRNSSLPRPENEIDNELVYAKMLHKATSAMEVRAYILDEVHEIIRRLVCSMLRQPRVRVPCISALAWGKLERCVVHRFRGF
jgi:hypothetical protein